MAGFDSPLLFVIRSSAYQEGLSSFDGQVVGCAAVYLGDLSNKPLSSWRAIVCPQTSAGPWLRISSLAIRGAVPEVKVTLTLYTGHESIVSRRRGSLQVLVWNSPELSHESIGSGMLSKQQPLKNEGI